MNPQEPDLPLSDEDALSPTLPDLRDRELEGLDPRELIDAGLHSRTAPDKWEPPTPESLARLLPQYEIDALLGRGGMGAVYRGRQVTLDRRVAIKLLPAELTRDAEFVARFEREARTLAKLHHPGIVLVHDFGQTSEGHLYFVMEFVDGTDLHRIIHGPGLDCAQALEIVGQICDALQYAHSQGVVHRDIKPANVILALNGRAKLADFGLARPFDDGSGAFTRSNVVMGTPDYMAPEALAGAADHRADLYSLGVMLYEMLTGRPPRGAWAPPSQRVQVDVRLDEVVVRALQEDPELRYQQASEIKTDVDVIRTTPVQGVAEERKGKQNGKTAVPGKKPSRQNAKKSAVGAWIVALGLAAVLGAGMYWALKDWEKEMVVTEPAPASVVATVAPEAHVLAARERGGRLRVFGNRSDGSIELGVAANFDDFVEVEIGNSGWVARRANGETYGQVGLGFSQSGKHFGPLFATQVMRGMDSPWMRMSDGSFGNLINEEFKRLFDPSLTDTSGILAAYGTVLILDSDGTMHPTGGGWDVPGRQRPPADFFLGASAWASADVSYLAADRLKGVKSFRADGTLTAYPASFRHVIEMDAGRDHVVMRSESGEVFVSDGIGKPYEFGSVPRDLGPAVAIRAGTRMSAAQMVDGSWKAWGESTDLINQVREIGPAIDLDLHSDSTKVAYMMWIEPVAEDSSAGDWTRIERSESEWQADGLTVRDGWVDFGSKTDPDFAWNLLKSAGVNPDEVKDAAVRFRYRWIDSKQPQTEINLRARRGGGAQNPFVTVWNTSSRQGLVQLPQNENFGDTMHPKILKTGDEGTMEFAIIGNRILFRMDGRLVRDDTKPGISNHGEFEFRSTNCLVRDFEYLILDGIADPLQALGWEVPDTASGDSPWIDLLSTLRLPEDVTDPGKAGAFKKTADGIELSRADFALVELPIDLEGAYEFRSDVTLDAQYFPVGRISLPVSGGKLVGFNIGKRTLAIHHGETSVVIEPSPFTGGKRQSILARVEPDGANVRLRLWVDGRSVFDQSVKPATKYPAEEWGTFKPNRISLGGHGPGPEKIIFHSVEVRPIENSTADELGKTADWVSLPMNEQQTAEAAANDGWTKPFRWYPPGAGQFTDGAVRLNYRWTEGAQMWIDLRKSGTDEIPQGVQLKVRQSGRVSLSLWQEKTDEFTEELQLPALNAGDEGMLEFAVIGTTVYARVNGQAITLGGLPEPWKGVITIGAEDQKDAPALKGVEYFILDGVADPLQALGWVVPKEKPEDADSLWQKADWGDKDLPFLASDGWMTAPSQLQSFGPFRAGSRSQLKFKDGVVRALLRRDASDQINIYFHALESGDPIALQIYETELIAKIAPGGKAEEHVELGRITFDTPLRQGDAEVVEAAVVGDTYLVRFKGQELRFQTPEPTTAGVISFHGRNYAVKDVEYAILDGIADPLRALGWEVLKDDGALKTELEWTAVSMTPEISAQAAANDGWVTPFRWYSSGGGSQFRDGVIRMRYRFPEKNGFISIKARMRSDQYVNLQFKDSGEAVLSTHRESAAPPTVLQRWSLPIPSAGKEGLIQFAFVGDRLLARIDGHEVRQSGIATDQPGRIEIANGYPETPVAFKEVEYAILDGVEDPLKALGWELPDAVAPQPEPVDLLALIDIDRNVRSGQVKRNGTGIEFPESKAPNLIEIPYVAPPEYDLEAEFTPTRYGNNVNVHLSAGGRSFAWKINAYANNSSICGSTCSMKRGPISARRR